VGKVGDELSRRGLTNDELIRLFLQAQDAIIRSIERANPTSPFRAYRVQQVRAIEQHLVTLRAKARKWTATEIPILYTAGAEETREEIRKLDEADFTIRFAGINQTAVRCWRKTRSWSSGTRWRPCNETPCGSS